MNLFLEEFENDAIERIKKFSKLCKSLDYIPVLGFSGGKDSQVCYDLCIRAGIEFKAVFNHCFESAITLNFIKKYYPNVEWRREVKEGFFENIRKKHNGFLPTVQAAYCCKDYKHNPKYVDKASIVGVRQAESQKRKGRRVLETKTKTFLKKNKNVYDYFSENCVASGAPSEIQLKPIVDWSDDDVWDYLKKYNLHVNPEYSFTKRIGCVICPKASFERNFVSLMRYPKLIDAIIRARECQSNTKIDWIITSEKKDYSDNKIEYVCRWLNHSFMPFTKKQQKLFEKLKELVK